MSKVPVDIEKVKPFEVILAKGPSFSRQGGFTVKAPREITWYMGVGNTAGWYKRKSDAQTACDAMNKALRAGRLNLVAVEDYDYRDRLAANKHVLQLAEA